MYKKLLLSLLTLLVTMSVYAKEISEVQSVTPTEEDATQIQNAVKKALKDSDSAKFLDPIMMEGPFGKAACIPVNAKNSFGGYSGFQTAMAIVLEDIWLPVEIHDDGMDFCKRVVTELLETGW